MAKTITLRLEESVYRILKVAAEADRRSLANLLEVAALRHIEENVFADEEETHALLANKRLAERLAKAHRQARVRQGKMVRGL